MSGSGRGGRGGGRGGRGRGRGGGGGGRGRGAYYKAKYGGGRGRRGGPGDSSSPAPPPPPPSAARSLAELEGTLRRIDGRPYPAYKDLYGSWAFDAFTLVVDHVQGDAYAAPSRCHVDVSPAVARIPAAPLANATRRRALADYLNRQFAVKVHELGVDQARGGGGWKGEKGGDMRIAVPSQHILQRSAVTVTSAGAVQARFTLALPARGRSISGGLAAFALTTCLPDIVQASLLFASQDAQALQRHVLSAEDQTALRQQLSARGLAAFVRNGAVLPRASGASDKPMAGGDVVPFASPPSLETTLTLPNVGDVVGMGIPKGVTLIVGGGFHGKSTLLQALEVGVYDHVPGDGREGVGVDPGAVKVRAEDGRAVHCVDISAFINNLPQKKDTSSFSTPDASGSTSQAAGIAEALEAGATTLLIDEDTAATNFMIRDARMQMLVAAEAEPITPFIARVRQLWEEKGVSSILVIGGAGEYFDVADTVLQMDTYVCKDVTARAKEIAAMAPSLRSATAAGGAGGSTPGQAAPGLAPLADPKARCPSPAHFAPGGKVFSRSQDLIQYGDVEVQLGAVEQLVEAGQTRALASVLQWVGSALARSGLPSSKRSGSQGAAQGKACLAEVLDWLDAAFDADAGMDVLDSTRFEGGWARPRRFEIAAALNRLRSAEFTQG